ncbi:MAG TPA: hypothetical protein PLD36_05250, partial [Bacteroidia bacterium]|nr:hypothetical protein [Bacteroidia bacterium]
GLPADRLPYRWLLKQEFFEPFKGKVSRLQVKLKEILLFYCRSVVKPIVSYRSLPYICRLCKITKINAK